MSAAQWHQRRLEACLPPESIAPFNYCCSRLNYFQKQGIMYLTHSSQIKYKE